MTAAERFAVGAAADRALILGETTINKYAKKISNQLLSNIHDEKQK